MTIIEVKIKRVGKEMRVILPKEFVKEQNIKEGEKLRIRLVDKRDLTKIFGSLNIDKDRQEFKDTVRDGWKK